MTHTHPLPQGRSWQTFLTNREIFYTYFFFNILNVYCNLNLKLHFIRRPKISPALRLRYKNGRIKWSRYRPGVAHRVGRGIALLFHDRGTRRGWVASSTPRPHFTPGKDPVPILQKAGWAPGPVWTGGKSRPNRDSIPDRPARSQSLYRLSYRAHSLKIYNLKNKMSNDVTGTR